MATSLIQTRRYTIDDLETFPDDGRLRELVDGQIVEWDVPNHLHAFLVAALTSHLWNFVQEHRLGRIVSGDAMVRIQGSAFDARGGDIAFYSRGRLPQDITASATIAAPDFVVEILSPSDRADRVFAKVQDWLRTGVRLLWYVDPETGTTTVYRGDHVTYVGAEEHLDGGDVLPSLQLRMGDLLQQLQEQVE